MKARWIFAGSSILAVLTYVRCGVTLAKRGSVDRNDNKVTLDEEFKDMKIFRQDPNFFEGDLVHDSNIVIMFRDADSLEANRNVNIRLFDRNNLFVHTCTASTWPDSLNLQSTVFLCDIRFKRDGHLNKKICFKLKAFDRSIEKKPQAVAKICVSPFKTTTITPAQDATTEEQTVATETTSTELNLAYSNLLDAHPASTVEVDWVEYTQQIPVTIQPEEISISPEAAISGLTTFSLPTSMESTTPGKLFTTSHISHEGKCNTACMLTLVTIPSILSFLLLSFLFAYAHCNFRKLRSRSCPLNEPPDHNENSDVERSTLFEIVISTPVTV